MPFGQQELVPKLAAADEVDPSEFSLCGFSAHVSCTSLPSTSTTPSTRQSPHARPSPQISVAATTGSPPATISSAEKEAQLHPDAQIPVCQPPPAKVSQPM